MEKQQFLIFGSNSKTRLVLVFLVTLALIVTMIPALPASGNAVEAESAGTYNQTKDYVASQCAFDVTMTADGYISYGVVLKNGFDFSKHRLLIVANGDYVNPIFNGQLNQANGDLYLKKGEYSFGFINDSEAACTGIQFLYTIKYNRLNIVRSLPSSSGTNVTLTGQYSEAEVNDDTPTEIKYFGENNRYIGNFGAYNNSYGTSLMHDVDKYKFTLKYRAPINVNIQYVIGVGADNQFFDIKLYSTNPDNPYFEGKQEDAVPTAQKRTEMLPPGDYYLEIGCNGESNCWGEEYTISIEDQITINSAFLTRSFSSAYYTGDPISFVSSLTYQGTPLIEGKDYEVVYSKGNVNIGEGTFYIKGKEGFNGTKGPYSYIIKPKKSTISTKKTTTSSTKPKKRSLTLKWKKIKSATHYQVKYRVKGAKKWKSKTIKATKTSLKLKKLKKGKRYQFKVRGVQKLKGYPTYYSKYSKTKTTRKIK